MEFTSSPYALEQFSAFFPIMEDLLPLQYPQGPVEEPQSCTTFIGLARMENGLSDIMVGVF